MILFSQQKFSDSDSSTKFDFGEARSIALQMRDYGLKYGFHSITEFATNRVWKDDPDTDPADADGVEGCKARTYIRKRNEDLKMKLIAITKKNIKESLGPLLGPRIEIVLSIEDLTVKGKPMLRCAVLIS